MNQNLELFGEFLSQTRQALGITVSELTAGIGGSNRVYSGV